MVTRWAGCWSMRSAAADARRRRRYRARAGGAGHRLVACAQQRSGASSVRALGDTAPHSAMSQDTVRGDMLARLGRPLFRKAHGGPAARRPLEGTELGDT